MWMRGFRDGIKKSERARRLRIALPINRHEPADALFQKITSPARGVTNLSKLSRQSDRRSFDQAFILETRSQPARRADRAGL